jgi:hypothetical protein
MITNYDGLAVTYHLRNADVGGSTPELLFFGFSHSRNANQDSETTYLLCAAHLVMWFEKTTSCATTNILIRAKF